MAALYVCTAFLSASLLFWVQPMFAKMVLPLLGGTPTVWNTALVFYQGMLLAGYAFAHLTARLLEPRRQALLQAALLALALVNLPITIAEDWRPPPQGWPVPWLLLLFALSLGLPLFAISANTTMLQRWLAHTAHRAAADPYFLYSASNLGSVAALLAYPILLEPSLSLGEQSRAWAAAYLLLTALILASAFSLWRNHAPAAPAAGGRMAKGEDPLRDGVGWGDRLGWTALSFAPASLLLGVTAHLTMDVAPVPLLWVVPLILYLLTFANAFARRPLMGHWVALRVQPFAVAPLVGLMFWVGADTAPVLFPLHLFAFLATALVCHGELAARRPGADCLTDFYLCVSLGGFLGGAFAALIAPLLFNSVVEYPLALVVACALRPPLARGERAVRGGLMDIGLPALLGLGLWGAAKAFGGPPGGALSAMVIVSGVLSAVVYSFHRRPLRFALGIAAGLLAGSGWADPDGLALVRERNFFGVLRVTRTADGRHHLLHHGTTLHGAQSLDPRRRREPLAYYSRRGPLGQVFTALNDRLSQARVAVVGLGAGASACYARPGQRWTFYEINPAVERIARDPALFTFLKECLPDAEVVLGDARLSLGRAPDGAFDLIVLDAFSSDAIPVHLLTREALELYLAKLAGHGVIAFNISNRHLDLKPVLGNVALSLGLASRVQVYSHPGGRLGGSSVWAIVARRAGDLGRMAGDPRWGQVRVETGVGVWTDDFSNIFAATVWRWRGDGGRGEGGLVVAF